MLKIKTFAFYIYSSYFIISILTLISLHALANTSPMNSATIPQATWFRYYDQNGIANLSNTVKPAHIEHGYDILDQNMILIRKVPPYDKNTYQNNAAHREKIVKQQQLDLKYKSAYGNSKTAVTRRDEHLKALSLQLKNQQLELQQLQKNHLLLKQQIQLHPNKQGIPKSLQIALVQNEKNIENSKNNIQLLQTRYRQTNVQYDTIINRLKSLE